MATDIKISELNEITANDDINYIIVNDRENAGDEGITKKITLENFLTPNIVQETNILNDAVTRDKIEDLAVDCSKIASNTITCNQILGCTINNPSLDSNSVDNRVLNNNCNFTVKGLLVNDGCINISNPTNGCLQITSGVTRLNGVQYNWPDIQTADRFLKTDGSGNLSWQEAVPGESTALVFAEIMPVGTIIPWGGADDIPDDKWLACNGGLFNGPQYPELSAAIGENFGARIGEGFRLPDLRGKVPVGSAPNGASDGTDTCNFDLGATGGKYNHRLTSQQSGLPSHKHINGLGMTNESSNLFGGCGLGGAFSDYPLTCDKVSHNGCKGDFSPYTQTVSSDAAQSHNNIQPYMVTKYIIKARPDDIQQFNPEVGPGLSARDVTGQTANVTLTSLEIGLKVSDDFEFDTGGRLALVDPNYRPGEIIESFSALSNGRNVTIRSGTYTMPNVTLHYDVNPAIVPTPLTNALTRYLGDISTPYLSAAANTGYTYDVTGSLIRYKLPANATRVKYTFTYNWSHIAAYNNPLFYFTPFIGGGEGTTSDDETWTRLTELAVTPAQYGSFEGQHAASIYLEITDIAQEEDVEKGIIYRGNWPSGGRSLLWSAGIYNASYPVRLYTNYHLQKSFGSVAAIKFIPPSIEITTYA